MARRPLKDVHPTIAEILNGDHDDILHGFEQAAKLRRKAMVGATGLRKGAKVRVKTDAAAGDYAGREGVVSKVNPKTISVNLACDECGSAEVTKSAAAFGRISDRDEVSLMQAEADNACGTCYGYPDEIRCSAGLLEVV
jgi:hypothetical protein